MNKQITELVNAYNAMHATREIIATHPAWRAAQRISEHQVQLDEMYRTNALALEAIQELGASTEEEAEFLAERAKRVNQFKARAPRDLTEAERVALNNLDHARDAAQENYNTVFREFRIAFAKNADLRRAWEGCKNNIPRSVKNAVELAWSNYDKHKTAA